MRRGYIQVYTGTGKGKTTAALGLAMRAAGAGMKVLIIQFIKKRRCSEHKALERFEDLITIKQYGEGFILKRKPSSSDIEAAKAGLEEAKQAIQSRLFGMVILDEANIAVNRGLISPDELVGLMEMKPGTMELVITGRYADEKIIEKADLVTEMREIKHYKEKGIKARRGIEY
ncbi:MAG: cob(I)yrinic acid a,c-diamide adenosyltransferase [Nitrospirae bacterium]|nr:cob(I)yrinic acid a,c-diamide adenosyltransferase [Nitrospirota bacterium]